MQNARNSLCRKQWTILWENSEQFYLMQKTNLYECSKQIQIYSKHDGQSANFINVETNFINAEK